MPTDRTVAITEAGASRPDAPTRVEVVFLGERPDEPRFDPPAMEAGSGDHTRPPGKPHGGLWTCRHRPSDPDLGLAWVRWCRLTGWGDRLLPPNHLWLLSAPSPKLLVIDSKAAYDAATRDYPHQWLPHAPLGLPDLFTEIDYRAVLAEGYDAVELTETGLRELRHAWPPTLTGWDVPSILWLRFGFDRVERLWEHADVVR
jgi:hypothetical protein